jgi:purine-cytosine permease-like protein
MRRHRYRERMSEEPGRQPSRLRQIATTVYDAQGGGRWPALDGPWWLALAAVVCAVVLTFGSGPWRWVAIAVVVILFWLPFVLRWSTSILRSAGAFRDGFRS